MLKKCILKFTNLWYDLFRIGSGNMDDKYSALDIAKYLICNCNNDEQPITQLRVQKLLYFIEAYYMAKYDKEALYNEDFHAWLYGPMIKEIYNKYKVFMSDPIIEEDCDNIINLPQEVKDCINTIISIFGKLSTSNLITITHQKDSAWSKTQEKKVILKSDTKKWFSEVFLKNQS